MGKFLTLVVVLVIVVAPAAWGSVALPELALSGTDYIVTSPFDYDPAHPYDGGQNRGVDVIAAGGRARAVADGRVAFVGVVAGRSVVTVRSVVEKVPVVVTYTGLASSFLRVGDDVRRRDIVGAAEALHIGAYVADERHAYLPIGLARAGASVSPSHAAGARTSTVATTPPIAAAVIRRLQSAIDGTARLLDPRSAQMLARHVPSPGAATVRRAPEHPWASSQAKRLGVVRPEPATVGVRARASSRVDHVGSHDELGVAVTSIAKSLASLERVPIGAAGGTPSTQPRGSTALALRTFASMQDDERRGSADARRSVSNTDRSGPAAMRRRWGHHQTGVGHLAAPRAPAGSGTLAAAAVEGIGLADVDGPHSSAAAIGAAGVRAPEVAVRRVSRTHPRRWPARIVLWVLVLLSIVVGAVLLLCARRSGGQRGGGQPLTPLYIWQVTLPWIGAPTLRRSHSRGREAERVRLANTNGSVSRRERRRPREPA